MIVYHVLQPTLSVIKSCVENKRDTFKYIREYA